MLSVGIGEKVTLRPLFVNEFQNHTFHPLRWKGVVMGRTTGVNFVDTLERPLQIKLIGGDCDRAVGKELWAFQNIMCPTWRFQKEGAFKDDPTTTEVDERMILPASNYYVMLDAVQDTPLSPIAILDYFSKRFIRKRKVGMLPHFRDILYKSLNNKE